MRSSHAGARAPAPSGTPIGRRVFLGMVGLGALGVVTGASVQDALSGLVRPLQSGASSGLASLIPGGGGWRYYTVTSGYPSEPDARYRLRVGGLVERPLTLTLADLKAMPATSLVRDFQCVTGWRVARVHWRGVALGDLLARAGVQPAATAVHFQSFDGLYTESLTLDQARRRDVIVAYEMLGAPVTTEHGGPVRLYVAPMYGYKSVKWLSGITATRRLEPGYWEQEGDYAMDAWVGHSNGRTDPPT